MKRFIFTMVLGTFLLFLTGLAAAPLASAQLTNIELLGKYVFWDKISEPKRMACVTCHNPQAGWTLRNSGTNLHQVGVTGANPHTVGNLKPPTNAYATLIPRFQECPGVGIPQLCGGNFWNGRAEGNEFPPEFPAGATKHIGDEIFYTTDGFLIPDVSVYAVYFGAVADQALNPMPNVVEQNIQRQAVCQQVALSKYAPLYESVWRVEIDCSDDEVKIHAADVGFVKERAFDISFKRLMLAVCAYQGSIEVNSFSSKRDIALRRELDGIDVDETPGKFPLVGFTAQENLGHDLFYGTNESGLNNGGPGGRPKNARCAGCHLSDRANPDGTGQFERYADDGYHNIGIPLNTEIPFTGTDPDAGLFGHTGTILIRPPFPPGAPPQRLDPLGMHKTTTLRNVDKRPDPDFVKAYGHNGWFKSLESIVHFYNTAAMEEDLAPFGIPKLHNVTRCPPEITTEKDALANNCWPAPAYSNGIAIPFLVGNLGLTSEEEAAIVAYLKTFTDTFTPKQPAPYNAKKR